MGVGSDSKGETIVSPKMLFWVLGNNAAYV